MPATMLVPPWGATLGSLEQRFGTSDALEGGGSVLKEDARHARVEADENRVGTENDGVSDAILAGGKVDGLVRGDGFSNDFGIVGGAVTAGAESADVGPGVHGREGANVGFDGVRKSDQWRSFKNVLNGRGG